MSHSKSTAYITDVDGTQYRVMIYVNANLNRMHYVPKHYMPWFTSDLVRQRVDIMCYYEHVHDYNKERLYV